MIHLEQSVADQFNQYMGSKLQERGKSFYSFSLGGQDRDTGDYLISDVNGFALIEFKYTEAQFKDEGRKSRREELCKLLGSDAKMRALHDQCHFIAWMDSGTGELRCAPYRSQICNQSVFSTCDAVAPDSKHSSVRDYCDEFVTPPPERTASKENFETYLSWLMQRASGSDRSTVSLLARAPDSCFLIRLPSIEDAYNWMMNQLPPPRLKGP